MVIKVETANITLEDIEANLKNDMPNLIFFFRKNLSGRHLIVKQSKTVGQGIYLKNNEIKIVPVIPSLKFALLLGMGAPLLVLFKRKERKELQEKLSWYLLEKYKST